MYDSDPGARDKVYSHWGGFIDAVRFDPIAFGLPPKSLDSIEPFQLLALVTAQAALRDAGYGTRPFDRERTSVILGAGGGGADLSVGYTVRSALPSLLGDAVPELQEKLNERLPEWTEDSFAGLLMNVAAGRIANRLDLGGTNYTVDAACASSLAAIGLATRELQSGTSDDGARRRRRRDPEPVRVPVLRQDARPLSARALPAIRRERRRHRDQRGIRDRRAQAAGRCRA